ncbi:hypothetical protein BSKO_02977 [Bryopsis sp. KO-2023]|nr:hypothetical protein BSKO_02977 [Bryopsis sp. KO-2023]
MDDHANGLTSFPTPSSQPVPELPPATVNGTSSSTPVVAIPTVLVAVEGGPPQKKRRGRPPKTQILTNGVEANATPEAPKSTRRGRPPGSRNKVSRATTGVQPHVLMVNTGEDIVEKLRSFSMTYKRSLCILAASGALSSATLMQVGQGGHGVGVTLAGQFTVLSISGAVLHEHGDPASGEPKVFLSASLANPTGGVVGGTVAGPMEANGSAMVVVGHWAPDNGRIPLNQSDSQSQIATSMQVESRGVGAVGTPGVTPSGTPGITPGVTPSVTPSPAPVPPQLPVPIPSPVPVPVPVPVPAPGHVPVQTLCQTPTQAPVHVPAPTPVPMMPALSPPQPMPAFPLPLANFPNPPLIIPSASRAESGTVEMRPTQPGLELPYIISGGGGPAAGTQPAGVISSMSRLPSTSPISALLPVPVVPLVSSVPNMSSLSSVPSLPSMPSITSIPAHIHPSSAPIQYPMHNGLVPNNIPKPEMEVKTEETPMGIGDAK